MPPPPPQYGYEVDIAAGLRFMHANLVSTTPLSL